MTRGTCFAILLAALTLLAACAPAQPQAAPATAPPPGGAKPAKPQLTPAAPAAKPTAPTKPSEVSTAPPAQGANITLTAPTASARIASPVRVTGTARVFEGTVDLAVKDASGKVIGKATTPASAGAPEWGKFDAQVAFEAPGSEQQGSVEAFSRSARDGSVQDLVSVKVTLLPR